MKIRKIDLVAVITGNDADLTKSRRVLRTLPSKDKVVVEGVNRVYKHVRPSKRNMQGGRLSKEMPIQQSNVLLFCPSCRRGVRTAIKIDQDGSKFLACKKCTGHLRLIARPKAVRIQG